MSKLNVLVVDASKSVLASVNDYFDNIDEFKLFLAKSGKDALETIEDEKNIDCVFLDWDLPVMNGLEALVEIKKRYPKIFVIMMTSKNGALDIQNMLSHGATGNILKPLAKENMFDKLEEIKKKKAGIAIKS